jgi:hypothetical protein
MSILYLFSAIIAVLGVFVGLIIIIKGFAYKSNKNINLGTILVSIGLIVALSGAFCIAQRANHFRKKMMHKREIMMKECMKECDMDEMEGCAVKDTVINGDTVCIKTATKVIMEKNCSMSGKKCDGKCKHDMH